MNGPTNFNHSKVYKPITTCRFNRVQWYKVYEQIEIPPGWTIFREEGCSECENMVALRASRDCINIIKSKPLDNWTICRMTKLRMAEVTKHLATPGEGLENIWVSGTGSQSSMFRWNNDWWILYGTRNRAKQNDKIIILHKPMAIFSLRRLEEARMDLIKTMATELK